MVNISIRKCDPTNIGEFSRIISQAFNDKFPFFFKSIPEEDYIELVKLLKLNRMKKEDFHGIYILEYDGKYVAALNLIYMKMKPESFRFIFKTLRQKMKVWYAFRTSIITSIEDYEKVKPNTLEIKALGVDQTYRKKGIGYKLLQFSEDLARKKNMKHLELSVLSRNQGAISLYKSYGFKIISTKKIWLAKIFLDIDAIHTMRKDL
ncbi:GNAT family N-acetyltransferase [Promethearchaeum syntrophicum]|uniref:GNAT family N-acetyltransferase n=1 Tax=Promethearchaeum syntrophicum TaxID=2594042 RepID=A0A5B9D914_9ARCH|nr:GNAT family N-acetyltransferase [Candidatus Prometheoarchaeum syntrophicum]QEE15614.1 TDP-fucosamine acetyltransferase [Candidatus Prometheoarchaeum syntrophicum]